MLPSAVRTDQATRMTCGLNNLQDSTREMFEDIDVTLASIDPDRMRLTSSFHRWRSYHESLRSKSLHDVCQDSSGVGR